jgi:hypothetical protein
MLDPGKQLPDRNRLSILISIILLAYTLTHFVSIPDLTFEITILGIFFPLRLNFSTLVTLLVAGLTASGSAWLLQDHPASLERQTTAAHWLLPSLTSLVLMLAIEQLPFGPSWWIAASISGFILLLVFIGEYIVLEPSNPYYPYAEIGITALSIVLFLIMSIALHFAEVRLFFRIPVISIGAALVYLRIIHLRQKGLWAFSQGAAAFILIGELAAGLHYWPMNSFSYGLVLVGPLFALIELSDHVGELVKNFHWKLVLWPGLLILISWGFALLI